MVVGFAGMSWAQTGVTVSANVVTALTVAKVQDLSFGSVLQGDTVTVASASAKAGEFKVTGTLDVPVTYTFSAPSSLLSGSNSISFAPAYPVYDTTQSYSGGTPFTSTTSQTLTLSTSTTSVWIYVGGTVGVGASTPTGSYSGTYTLTVTY